MKNHVYDDIRLKHQDSIWDARNDAKLYLKNLDEFYVYDDIELLFVWKDS